MKQSALLLVLATLLPACGEEPAPTPTAPPPVVAKKPVAPPPVAQPGKATPLSESQKQALEAAFNEARGYAKEADGLKIQADAIERAQGRAAANDKLVQAKELYHKACDTVSDWLDGDLAGKVTDAQVKDYLGSYVTEAGRWQKAISDIGKVHKDD